MMDDVISRQATIKAIEQLNIPEDMCVFEILSHIMLAIATLPSAQSERTEQIQEETIEGIARFMAKKDWNRRTENG